MCRIGTVMSTDMGVATWAVARVVVRARVAGRASVVGGLVAAAVVVWVAARAAVATVLQRPLL